MIDSLKSPKGTFRPPGTLKATAIRVLNLKVIMLLLTYLPHFAEPSLLLHPRVNLKFIHLIGAYDTATLSDQRVPYNEWLPLKLDTECRLYLLDDIDISLLPLLSVTGCQNHVLQN